MNNILKAKIGFQSGVKAGIISSVAFIALITLTIFIDEGISRASLSFHLIEVFSVLPAAGFVGAVFGGLFGTLIGLTLKTPRHVQWIGIVIGIIACSLYPALLLVLDGIRLRYLLLLLIGITVGAFAGRYGGLDFKSKWAQTNKQA